MICKVATLIAATLFLHSIENESLHLQGTWETGSFFLFLSKFGFQKTDLNNKNDTQGYIFGNVTSATDATWLVNLKRLTKRSSENSDSSVIPPNSSVNNVTRLIKTTATNTAKPKAPLNVENMVNVTTSSTAKPSTSTTARNTTNKLQSISTMSTTIKSTTARTTTTTTPVPPVPLRVYPVTFVVLDRGLFVDFYRNRDIADKTTACRLMFEQISHIAYDPNCNKEGTEHLYQRMPCIKGQLCPEDSSNTSHVVKFQQFTHPISNPNQPNMVACWRDPVTCEWKHSGDKISVDYDVWLVNGSPYSKFKNPLKYQFSFDRQETGEVYLLFFVCYLVLFPLQVNAVLRQRHIVPRLFAGSMALELGAVFANVVHVLKFSVNGVGYPSLAAFGDIMDIAARAFFMLILCLLAKGWAITRTELASKPFIFTIWTLYGVVHILLYVWKETEVDVIEDIDEYQTQPGWLILFLRNVIMVWFLYELKNTMDHEHQPHKLNFFLHFGAASLVWFIYLPIIALIALRVSVLWRSKLILGITYSADCLAFAVMTHLLWPTRSQQYFLLSAKDTSLNDELEEFNEAPHVINSYSHRSNIRPTGYFHRGENEARVHENGVNNAFNSYDDCKDDTPLIIT